MCLTIFIQLHFPMRNKKEKGKQSIGGQLRGIAPSLENWRGFDMEASLSLPLLPCRDSLKCQPCEGIPVNI